MSDATRKVPASRLGEATAYTRPAPRRPGLLRLDGNEGAHPPGSLLRDLGTDVAALLRLYPDASALEARLAETFGIDADRVIVTAGADDALDRACRAFLGSGREIVLPTPTFEMLERYARLADATLMRVPWTSDEWPRDAVLARLTDRTGVVALVSPNNPTGGVVSREDLLIVARAAPDALVLLDHAYVEYADDDLSREALALPNVLVVRTFSKAWGLAGCRVGYALGSPEVVSLLRRAGAPYAVSGPSLALALARLDADRPALDAHVAEVRTRRAEIGEALRARGVAVARSEANFVLADLGGRAAFTRDALESLGVLVRSFPGREELSGRLRITVPARPEDQRLLLDGVDTALAPEALLLDLDGVLANVEGSYRSCLLATCASFGVVVTREELLAAVMDGDANNDWTLSQRMLSARGLDVPIADVIARYQRLYLGDAGVPGLRESESLIVEHELVARLARRLPVAIVTGRPREEAEWFLRRFELRGLVRELVCLEDGPVKPDPAPVRLALSRLGVRRAWMVGDTPDDARAALGAGVLPLGVIAPGDEPAATRQVLLAAGCARVLRSLADIEVQLP